MLKRAITDTEISVHDGFMFVGREAYEAAGGKCVRTCSALRRDGTADGVLVGRLVQEKLESAALAVEMQEAGHGHWHGKGRSETTVTTGSIIWSCRSRRANSALTSSSVSMNCTPRRKPRRRMRMKPRFRC
jgi:hypothetical protein